MGDIICRNNILRYALNPDFHRIFHVGLGRYWNNITGFDIVEFDDRIVHSGEGHMSDTVVEKWGEEGRILILQALDEIELTSAQRAEAMAWLGDDHVRCYYPTGGERDDAAP